MNNDEELTRKAVDEIMEQMEAQKQADQLPPLTPQERKLNPLGRPNKDFLDRTLNSVMTHNKRQLEKNYNKSQSKLRDLDEANASSSRDEMSRRQGRESQSTKVIPGKRKQSNSSRATSRSSRSSSLTSNTERKKILKKKKNRNKKEPRSKSSSSSCSSSSLSLDDSASTSRAAARHRNTEPFNAATHGYYVDPNMALAAITYSQMAQFYQQTQQGLVNAELEDNNDDSKIVEKTDDIPSDLSLSYHSPESELNVSVNSSSVEIDENGLLTFKLSSEEGEKQQKIKPRKRKFTKTGKKLKRIKSCDKDKSEENTSETDSFETKKNVVAKDITIISSSTNSESEKEDINKVIQEVSTIISSSSSESDNKTTGHITISSVSSSPISSQSSGTEADTSEEEKLCTKKTNDISLNHSPSETQAKTTEKSVILENKEKGCFGSLKRKRIYGNNMYLGNENENETSTDTGLDAIDLTSSGIEDKEDESPPKTDDNKSHLIIHEIEGKEDESPPKTDDNKRDLIIHEMEGIESLAKAEQEELPNEEKALAAKSISSEDTTEKVKDSETKLLTNENLAIHVSPEETSSSMLISSLENADDNNIKTLKDNAITDKENFEEKSDKANIAENFMKVMYIPEEKIFLQTNLNTVPQSDHLSEDSKTFSENVKNEEQKLKINENLPYEVFADNIPPEGMSNLATISSETIANKETLQDNLITFEENKEEKCKTANMAANFMKDLDIPEEKNSLQTNQNSMGVIDVAKEKNSLQTNESLNQPDLPLQGSKAIALTFSENVTDDMQTLKCNEILSLEVSAGSDPPEELSNLTTTSAETTINMETPEDSSILDEKTYEEK